MQHHVPHGEVHQNDKEDDRHDQSFPKFWCLMILQCFFLFRQARQCTARSPGAFANVCSTCSCTACSLVGIPTGSQSSTH